MYFRKLCKTETLHLRTNTHTICIILKLHARFVGLPDDCDGGPIHYTRCMIPSECIRLCQNYMELGDLQTDWVIFGHFVFEINNSNLYSAFNPQPPRSLSMGLLFLLNHPNTSQKEERDILIRQSLNFIVFFSLLQLLFASEVLCYKTRTTQYSKTRNTSTF